GPGDGRHGNSEPVISWAGGRLGQCGPRCRGRRRLPGCRRGGQPRRDSGTPAPGRRAILTRRAPGKRSRSLPRYFPERGADLSGDTPAGPVATAPAPPPTLVARDESPGARGRRDLAGEVNPDRRHLVVRHDTFSGGRRAGLGTEPPILPA